jgi:hypothetical protein
MKNFLIAIMLTCAVPACTSAQVQAVESAVSKVVVAAIQSGEVLDMLQQKADQAFQVVPNPALQRKVNHGIAVTRSTVSSILEASQGTGAAAQQDVETAIQKFKAAWADLQPVLAEAGIVGGGKLAVAADSVALPEPLLLKRK